MLQGFYGHLGILVEWFEEVVLEVCVRNTLSLELQFHLKDDFIQSLSVNYLNKILAISVLRPALRSRRHLWAACFQLCLKFHDPILVILVKTLVFQLLLRFLCQGDDLFSQSGLQGDDLGPHVLDLAIFFLYLHSEFVFRGA